MAVTYIESRVWRWPAARLLPRNWFLFMSISDDINTGIWFYVSPESGGYQRV